MLEQAAAQLEEMYEVPREDVPLRGFRSRESITVPAYPRCLATELKRQLLREVEAVWKEIRAIEIVFGEVEQELGDDPVHPSIRQTAGKAKALIESLRATLGGKGRLPEPGAEIEITRAWVRRSDQIQEMEQTT